MSIQALAPQYKDLGNDIISARYLPQDTQHPIGPFIFFDYLPTIELKAGTGIDVRPHPHIGLSTLSYLFAGRIHHRDSLGYDLILSPGDVLLMTSGRGIVHAERTPQTDRQQTHHMHMVQFWLALPQSHETMEPQLSYAPCRSLPFWTPQSGLHTRLAIGSAFEQEAPISGLLNPFLVDFEAFKSGDFRLDTDSRESGLFLVSGSIQINGNSFVAPALLILESRNKYTIGYQHQSRWLWFGGEPLDGPRIIWWNLVSSTAVRIEEAKEKWRKGLFEPVLGDPEFIPLPEN